MHHVVVPPYRTVNTTTATIRNITPRVPFHDRPVLAQFIFAFPPPEQHTNGQRFG